MASYFEEHSCNELPDGGAPDQMLHLARLLLDSGLAVDLEMEWTRIFGDDQTPPASKAFIDALPEAEVIRDSKCAICLAEMTVGSKAKPVKALPCRHVFHQSCIVPWIKRVASCPLCKVDLPTDDANYEEFKKQKKRVKEREVMIEELHNSMFG